MAEKKKKKPESANVNSKEVGFVEKGGKQFVLPKREMKQLERRDKLQVGETLAEQKEWRREEDIKARQADKALPVGTPGTVIKSDDYSKEDGEMKEAGFEQAPTASGEAMPVGAGDITSILPIGAGAGVAGLGVKAIGKKIMANIAKKKLIKHEVSVATISALTRQPVATVEKIIANRLANEEIKNIVKSTTAKQLGWGTKLGIGVGAISLAATISGADGIIMWYAIDNMATTAKMNTNKIVWKVRNGEVPADEALSLVEIEIDELMAARTKATMSATYNPMVMPYAKYVKMGMDGDMRSIEMDIESIRSLIK